MADNRPAFERATELVALQLATFRDDNTAPTKNDELMAGHIVGNLWANDLLNTNGENWVPVNRLNQQSTCARCDGTGVEKATAGDGYHPCPDCR